MKCPQCNQTRKFEVFRKQFVKETQIYVFSDKKYETIETEILETKPVEKVRCSLCNYEAPAEEFERSVQ